MTPSPTDPSPEDVIVWVVFGEMDFSLSPQKRFYSYTLSLSFIPFLSLLHLLFHGDRVSASFLNVYMALHLPTVVTEAHFLLRLLPLVPPKMSPLPLPLVALGYLEVPLRELSTFRDVLKASSRRKCDLWRATTIAPQHPSSSVFLCYNSVSN